MAEVNRRVVGKILGTLRGNKDFDNAITYHDYCYMVCENGFDTKPISRAQWDTLCDIAGGKPLMYASNVDMAIANAEAALRD